MRGIAGVMYMDPARPVDRTALKVTERVLGEISFDGPDRSEKRIVIDGAYVRKRLSDVLQTEDLSRFIL